MSKRSRENDVTEQDSCRNFKKHVERIEKHIEDIESLFNEMVTVPVTFEFYSKNLEELIRDNLYAYSSPSKPYRDQDVAELFSEPNVFKTPFERFCLPCFGVSCTQPTIVAVKFGASLKTSLIKGQVIAFCYDFVQTGRSRYPFTVDGKQIVANHIYAEEDMEIELNGQESIFCKLWPDKSPRAAAIYVLRRNYPDCFGDSPKRQIGIFLKGDESKFVEIMSEYGLKVSPVEAIPISEDEYCKINNRCCDDCPSDVFERERSWFVSSPEITKDLVILDSSCSKMFTNAKVVASFVFENLQSICEPVKVFLINDDDI